MKWAKVSKGRVQHVWPKIKKNPDGTTYEVGFDYRDRILAAGKKLPECFVEVPDNTQEGWIWYEDRQQYGPPPKAVIVPTGKPFKQVIGEVVDERLVEFKAEILAAIKEMTDAAKGQG